MGHWVCEHNFLTFLIYFSSFPLLWRILSKKTTLFEGSILTDKLGDFFETSELNIWMWIFVIVCFVGFLMILDYRDGICPPEVCEYCDVGQERQWMGAP